MWERHRRPLLSWHCTKHLRIVHGRSIGLVVPARRITAESPHNMNISWTGCTQKPLVFLLEIPIFGGFGVPLFWATPIQIYIMLMNVGTYVRLSVCTYAWKYVCDTALLTRTRTGLIWFEQGNQPSSKQSHVTQGLNSNTAGHGRNIASKGTCRFKAAKRWKLQMTGSVHHLGSHEPGRKQP